MEKAKELLLSTPWSKYFQIKIKSWQCAWIFTSSIFICSNVAKTVKGWKFLVCINEFDLGNLELSLCIMTFVLMISAPSRPLSPSLHFIISPNIITYSEALKRETIPWHSNIHLESASSLKNFIKHAQHKHAERSTLRHMHTQANSAFWEALPCGANKFPLSSHISVLPGCKGSTLKGLCWNSWLIGWLGFRLKKVKCTGLLERACLPQTCAQPL